MSEINYRQQWAEGEIEAGTLLDAIDALAQRCRELEAQIAQRDEAIDEWSGTAVQNGMECDTLRAEVADLKATLLEAERGNEELVRLRAERRELIDRLKNIVTNPCESKEALAFRVGHLLEHAACATTDGATATP